MNNDGLNDCVLHIPINPMGLDHNRLVLYYGNPNFPETDSLVICEDSNSIINSWACPLGDVNGDGYDDFTPSPCFAPAWVSGDLQCALAIEPS